MVHADKVENPDNRPTGSGPAATARTGNAGLQLLTKKQAGGVLGLCERSVTGLIASGRLRAVRLSPRAVRIDPVDLRDFIERAKQGT